MNSELLMLHDFRIGIVSGEFDLCLFCFETLLQLLTFWPQIIHGAPYGWLSQETLSEKENVRLRDEPRNELTRSSCTDAPARLGGETLNVF